MSVAIRNFCFWVLAFWLSFIFCYSSHRIVRFRFRLMQCKQVWENDRSTANEQVSAVRVDTHTHHTLTYSYSTRLIQSYDALKQVQKSNIVFMDRLIRSLFILLSHSLMCSSPLVRPSVHPFDRSRSSMLYLCYNNSKRHITHRNHFYKCFYRAVSLASVVVCLVQGSNSDAHFCCYLIAQAKRSENIQIQRKHKQICKLINWSGKNRRISSHTRLSILSFATSANE